MKLEPNPIPKLNLDQALTTLELVKATTLYNWQDAVRLAYAQPSVEHMAAVLEAQDNHVVSELSASIHRICTTAHQTLVEVERAVDGSSPDRRHFNLTWEQVLRAVDGFVDDDTTPEWMTAGRAPYEEDVNE